MVFENLTLFEVNLENSRFSASRGGAAGEETESDDYEAAEESGSGGRRLGRPLGVLVFLVIAGLAVRRYRSGGGEEVGSVDDADGITIEQAAEQ